MSAPFENRFDGTGLYDSILDFPRSYLLSLASLLQFQGEDLDAEA